MMKEGSLKGEVLPSLGGGGAPGSARGSQRNAGLAPISGLAIGSRNVLPPTAEDTQGGAASYGSRDHTNEMQVPRSRGLGKTSGGSSAQVSEAVKEPQAQPPMGLTVGPTMQGFPKDDKAQTARQIRSSGGPRENQSRGSGTAGGSMSSRPSSKGAGQGWGQKPPGPAVSGENQGPPQKPSWTQHQLPLTPAKVLKYHIDELTDFEQGEILDFPQIWYFGAGAQKVKGTASTANNHSYDDERGDYNIVLNDHVLYRYEVMNPLGKGSFGQVVRAYCYKNNTYNALKVIRNKKRFHHQALVEVKILEHLRERDVENTSNVVHVQDYFYFRNHLCITFELLSINLYEFIKNNNFRGVSLGLIRRFAIQLLTALRFCRKQRIIHCDFKPENVLLKNPTKSGIKVIDFGSSCFEDERVYTYIQSRFYRAPEVILGIPYDVAIDMWSFGCILAELYTGYPLFPGENEVEQLACIMEVCGLPPQNVLDNATRVKMFFDSKGNPRIVPNSRGKKRRPGTKDLQMALRTSETKFVNFLQACLRWDPRERFVPEDALRHEWILEGYAKQAQPAVENTPRDGHSLPSSSSGKRRSQHRQQSAQQPQQQQQQAGAGSFVFPPIDSLGGTKGPPEHQSMQIGSHAKH